MLRQKPTYEFSLEIPLHKSRTWSTVFTMFTVNLLKKWAIGLHFSSVKSGLGTNPKLLLPHLTKQAGDVISLDSIFLYISPVFLSGNELNHFFCHGGTVIWNVIYLEYYLILQYM